MKNANLLIIGVALAGLQGCHPRPVPEKQAMQASDAAATVEAGVGETARSAAMIVASMPEVNHPRTEQEIELHAALYRAAYQSNVGDFTRHYLLEPVLEESLPPLAVNHREFALRVLAKLADLNVPITWAQSGDPPGGRGNAVEYFPGTHERATRLRIRIIKRLEVQATVQAEVSDWTADVGSSRQAINATWDGQTWEIERDRVRLVW